MRGRAGRVRAGRRRGTRRPRPVGRRRRRRPGGRRRGRPQRRVPDSAGPTPPLHDGDRAVGRGCAVDLYRETLAELDALASGSARSCCAGSARSGWPGCPGDPATTRRPPTARPSMRRLRGPGRGACARTASRSRTTTAPLGQGLFLPDDAAMNPARACHSARRAGSQHRAALHENTRVHRVRAGEVVTERGTVTAARGDRRGRRRRDRLLPRLAGRVRTARLQMLATAPIAPGRLPCPVYGRWGYDYAQQTPDGRLFVGGGRDRFVEDEWTSATPTDRAGAGATSSASAARMAGGPVRVTHRWAASVGFTAGRPARCARWSPTAWSRSAATTAPAIWSARSPPGRRSRSPATAPRRRPGAPPFPSCPPLRGLRRGDGRTGRGERAADPAAGYRTMGR